MRRHNLMKNLALLMPFNFALASLSAGQIEVQDTIKNFWPMSEAQGINKEDVVGGITVQDQTGSPTRASDSQFSNFAEFDGDDRLRSVDTTPGLAVPATQDFTWVVWVKLANISGNKSPFTIYSGTGSSRQVGLLIGDDILNALAFVGGGATQISSSHALASDEWNMYVVFYDSTNNRLGLALDNNAVEWLGITGVINTGDYQLNIGAYSDADIFDHEGGLRHLMYFKGALLSDSAREWLYNDGFSRSVEEISPS